MGKLFWEFSCRILRYLEAQQIKNRQQNKQMIWYTEAPKHTELTWIMRTQSIFNSHWNDSAIIAFLVLNKNEEEEYESSHIPVLYRKAVAWTTIYNKRPKSSWILNYEFHLYLFNLPYLSILNWEVEKN